MRLYNHLEHFSSGGHSIRDIRVRGFKLCHGSALKRKQTEMELIYKLGTLQPRGMNINFHYI